MIYPISLVNETYAYKLKGISLVYGTFSTEGLVKYNNETCYIYINKIVACQ